ncbi:unnamed protein product [Thlaspi arvense]|uniref:separase n=1 Tax=Thlaspi arvense TaxID=13288 RepID=A0AAU9T1M9_THLAR|nr:unnamed protein product [Thlaspi arvense]
MDRDSSGDLFRAYELCLNCLESVSAQLTCKPHAVQRQRLRMIFCLDAWGEYEKVITQAFKLLERLRGSDIRSRKFRLLPEVQDGEADLAMVIGEAVEAIFKAVAMGQQTDDKPYRKVLLLLEEVRACFRVLDAKAYEELHRELLTNLGKCALSLVREAERFDGELVRSFCDSTVKEHFKFAFSKDEIYTVLSVLFTSKDRRISVTIDISMSLLRSLACQFVVETNEDLVDFVDLVSHYAHEFRAAGDMYCAQVSKIFSEMAATFSEAIPQLNLILRLYSSGLSITVYGSKFGESKLKDATDDWKIQTLLDDEARWQNLVLLLGMVDSYSGNVGNQIGLSLMAGHKNYNNKTNDYCTDRNKKTCWPQYVDALEFLCQPLADLIHSMKRKIVLKTEFPCVSAHLSTIHDAFIQFCDGFFVFQRCASDKGGRESDNNKALLKVAMAAFIVSLRTQYKLKICTRLVEDVIASPWIRSQELKNLSASLYSIGVDLCRNKELTKACKALKLCLKASWRCVEHLCQSDNDLSEDDIMDLVGETCKRCAFYLDILDQCSSSCKIKQAVVPFLESWLSAEHLIQRLPGPAAIVKQWVKIERGCHTNLDADDSCTTLYSLLSSSQNNSKRGIGKILQQELLAYDPLRSNLGQQTQIKIADILLKDVYVTEDMHIDRARILIWKARMTRTSGTEHLTDCIRFLSEAISILSDVHHRPNKEGKEDAPSSHQLAIAYCLRAFCIQEAEPNSKKVFQDISTSLSLWLGIPSLDDSGDSLPAENILPLLYNMIDLMSVKGCTELLPHIYQLIFRLFKWKHVELEVCLAMLWGCRRLSHALCPSPISDAFIRNLSENCGDKSTTISCDKSSFQSDITTDDITNAASELIISASLSGHSSFAAAYLYYDLCERLISFGKISEALSYAKEANRIRTRIFQQTFEYTVKKQFEKHNDAGKISEIQTYSITKFQVGIVNELVGNGLEAEAYLSLGKAISCSQSLFPFVVAFSSALGNLYHKKQSLDLAEKELQKAKEILIANQQDFSCVKCKLKFEVTLDKQLGDISRKKVDRVTQTNGFLHAESLFSAVLGKICCSAWKSCVRSHGEENGEGKAINRNGGEVLGYKSSKPKLSINKGPTESKGSWRGRRAKSSQTCVLKDNDLISEPTSRLTRSMRQSLKEQCQNCSNVPEAALKKPSVCNISDGSGGERVLLDAKNAVHGFCICYKGKCKQCRSVEVTESGSLYSLVTLKWELCHRRLASSILVNLGKCLVDSGRTHLAHEALLHSISVLFKSNWPSHNQPSVSQLLDFIGKEVTSDLFAIDRAIILYNLCWLSLRNYHCRSICCDLSNIPFTKLVSWLMLAFILSREVPIVFQKVSRLLACLYLLSASSSECSFKCDGNELSAKSTCSSCMVPEELDLPKLAPERTQDLVQFAKEFFNNLPSSTIICISVLGGSLNQLLQELMQIRSPVCAWVLVSRLNLKSQPVATLLPIDLVLKGDSAILSSTKTTEVKNLERSWLCPWGSTVVDDVAPAFKSILEESHASATFHGEDTGDNRSLWWKRREKLDHHLGKLLRNLEAYWMGPWRCLLLGDLSNFKLPDSVQKKLVKDLKFKCKMEVNEMLLKIILGGGIENCKGEACVAQLSLRNGCYVGREGYLYDEDSCKTPTASSNISESRHGLALELIHEAAAKLEQHDDDENREAIILVLDPEVQMLPWENIPILRKQEVYRMPCVGSISAVLKKRCLQGEPARTHVDSLPLIDPQDSYYLLNPCGDFKYTQFKFESWFRDENFEVGKAGSVPSAKELTEALQKHDLVLYLGHGSGAQYLPCREIEKLGNCCATFLMGCSSGSPWRKGFPQGVPLSYLLAGAPAIVANLWDVTDKDIDRFGEALLKAWLEERSDSEGGCSQCESLANELAAMNLRGNNTTRRSRRNKTAQSNGDGWWSGKIECNHKRRRKIGSFIPAAREECKFIYLNGAAPVCYGVLTVLREIYSETKSQYVGLEIRDHKALKQHKKRDSRDTSRKQDRTLTARSLGKQHYAEKKSGRETKREHSGEWRPRRKWRELQFFQFETKKMASTDDVRLLSLIESSHAGDVFASVSDYLRPFTALSSASRKQDRTLVVRSLGKQFLPFLNKSISLLPKRLSVVSNSDKEARESAGNLFRAYELCLDCLESVSAQLNCKPHTLQLKRLQMIYCLDAWGFYENVNSQAFKLLERLRGSDVRSRKCRLLPEVQDGEADLAMVIVEAVAAIFKAVAMGQQTDDKPYRRVLLLLEEVRAWFRVLDAKVYEKLHSVLVRNMGKCALSLVREAERFDEEFVRSFCDSTVKEHYKCALSKDGIYTFAREVLSVLFRLKDRRMPVTIDISMSLLRSLTCQFVAETNEDLVDFVDLVSYCAHKFRAAGDMYCAQVSKKISEMVAIFSEAIPQLNLILRLYSSGLSITVYDSKFGESKRKSATDDWKIQALLDDEARWQNLVLLLGMVDSYSGDMRDQTNLSLISGQKNYSNKTNDRNKKTCWPQYVDALEFLCQPLADLIHSVKRKIVLKTEFPCVPAHLSTIHDAFLLFCDGCLLLQRCSSDKEGRESDNNKALLKVAMAAFIVSLRTQYKLKISAHLVEDLIASPWIQTQELKHLLASLYNIGVVLYKNKELTEACKALKLCLKASWRCVEHLCQMFVNQSSSSDNDLSEDDVMGFVGETCNRCAFYLEILHQCSSCKIKQTVVPILENWLTAEHLIRRLPGPAKIVKQWVKIEWGCHTNLDADDSCTTLYSLLSSSKKKSKRGIGKILQQELLAYEPLRSNLGQQTQIKIADILLKDVYVTEDMHIDRARILIWKARMTRTSGTEHLTDCIRFLSEAISILSDVHHRPNKEGKEDAPSSHQLPIAYCLRAFCIQEAEPNSKKVFQDISTSLSLWLGIPSLDDSGDSLPAENILPLLYNMIDLMSVKGCTELLPHIYQLIFRLFKWKHVELEVCLAMLWERRRLSHALCPSPISDAFIRNLSDNCGDKSTCINFWIDCLKGSKANLIGFQQNFHDLQNDFLRTSDITTDDITDAASELISSASLSDHSPFVAAYLYYDLCERLISFGKNSEALSYAKEAYRIRNRIFQQKFEYTAEKQFEEHNDAGKISEIQTYSITKFQVFKSEATDFWPCGTFLWDIKRSYLSCWNVLQCYLESTLQVGIVNELIGNGLEAEAYLSLGKAISCSQSLFPFVVAFSSALGNLYHKKQSLDLAEKELQKAKEILIANQQDFSCVKCKLKFEVTLDKQLGDISQKNVDRVTQTDGFLHAESLFCAALGKICCSAWKSCLRSHGEENAEGKAIDRIGGEVLGSRRGRRAKSSQTCVLKDHDLISEPTSRLTRSMRQSLKEQCKNCSNVPEAALKKPSVGNVSDGSGGERMLLDAKNAVHGFCICYKGKCIQCRSVEVTESGSLYSLVTLKWELCHRRLASSILVNLVTSDLFAIDRAIILYNLCWLSLRNYHCRESRSTCCDLSHIPFTKLVSWLLLAFILSREVPIVFQKVSRLLACLYLLSASSVEFSFECDGNELSASHWVSYFHQASVGTHISYQFISDLSRRHKSQCLSDKECTEATCSSCMVPEEFDLPRLAPEGTQDLVQFAKEFFNNLPSSTIICISVLGGSLNQLLQELMRIRSPVCAWVLVSRLNLKNQPVATLLPIDSVLEDDGANLSSTEATQVKNLERRWLCPWGSTVIDDVAPAFKSILEESHASTPFLGEDTGDNRSLWWKNRKKLDHHLGKLLRILEASWLGPWRCLLLGDLPNYKLPDSVQKKLVKDLKSKCKMEVNEILLKVILGGGIENLKGEACVAQLSLRNGCYVGREGYLYDEDSCKTPTASSNISESRHGLALELIHEAAAKLEEQHDGNENREAIILVLDPEVQMLPWENIPTLRKQEVYRMPSVGSISAVLKKRCLRGEASRSHVASFPLIDPLDSFYLLNPGGDLSGTQVEFESWFIDQNFEGKAGSVPSTEELTEALKNHDLFLYFGHGSGAQYLSWRQIEKLDNCCAAFLMGCSSGSIRLKGCYIPQGVPLSYLLAGSPAIVANLWDVTDKDIDRFGKALLEAWFKERSDSSSSEGGCSECESLANELAAMNLKGNNNNNNNNKRSRRNKPAQSNGDGPGKIECSHRHIRKIGSFIAAAREACRLPYLIGAAPVCYGVPTGITRKKGIEALLPYSSSSC